MRSNSSYISAAAGGKWYQGEPGLSSRHNLSRMFTFFHILTCVLNHRSIESCVVSLIPSPRRSFHREVNAVKKGSRFYHVGVGIIWCCDFGCIRRSPDPEWNHIYMKPTRDGWIATPSGRWFGFWNFGMVLWTMELGTWLQNLESWKADKLMIYFWISTMNFDYIFFGSQNFKKYQKFKKYWILQIFSNQCQFTIFQWALNQVVDSSHPLKTWYTTLDTTGKTMLSQVLTVGEKSDWHIKNLPCSKNRM